MPAVTRRLSVVWALHRDLILPNEFSASWSYWINGWNDLVARRASEQRRKHFPGTDGRERHLASCVARCLEFEDPSCPVMKIPIVHWTKHRVETHAYDDISWCMV